MQRTRSNRSAVARAALLPVLLVALALGGAPSPAFATEESTSAAATEPAPAETPADQAGPADAPTDEAATLLAALASAQQVGAALGGGAGGVGGPTIGTDKWAEVWAHVQELQDLLAPGDHPPPDVPDLSEIVNVDEMGKQLQARLDELIPDRVDPQDYYDAALSEVERARLTAEALVEHLKARLFDAIGPWEPAPPPTPAELVAAARSVAEYVRGEGDARAQALLETLARLREYLTDEQTSYPARAAVTTVLLALGNAVNPLPSGLAPTSEAAYGAAGELLAWADEVARQSANADTVGTEDDPDSDEPTQAPTDDVRVVDSDVMVGDEAVVVSGPTYATKPEPEADPVSSLTAAAVPGASECGMYAGQTCQPPLRRESGRVIHRPIVRVVLVGSWWRGQPNLVAGLDNLFGSMSGSGFHSVLRQYYDTNGYIGANVTYNGTHVLDGTPPASVSKERVGQYAVRAARERAGWTTTSSVVWVVALPPGSLAGGGSESCGYQGDVTSGDRRYYIAQIDYPRAGCQPVKGDVRASLTTIAAHEYAGVVANPDHPTGWRDGLGQHLPDLCRALNIAGPGGERVHKLWSNGDGRCVSSFTPRFAYEVTATTDPHGDTGPGSPLTRGHLYDGASVTVRNTGNMPWLRRGGKKTYLATADNACSPLADTRNLLMWPSCRRINLPRFEVNPDEAVEITFTVRPDGSLRDRQDVSETFRMIAGTTWMENTGDRSAQVRLTTQEFAAFAEGAVPSVGYVAVGSPGQETKVTVTLRNTGSAHWYPGEVVHIGTPPGTSSPFAASDWPRGPGGCRACRAHRVTKLVPPLGSYSFPLTLRLPATMRPGERAEAEFYPYADVVRVADRGVSPTRMETGKFTVQIVSVPSTIGTREVFAAGFADDGTPTGSGLTSGFSCLAASNVDAVSTSITSCTATVTTASGYSHTADAQTVTAQGAYAVTRAAIGYDESAGDRIVVCWTASTRFLDGSTDTDDACTT